MNHIHTLRTCTLSYRVEIIGPEVLVHALLSPDYYDVDSIVATGPTYERACQAAVEIIAERRNDRPCPADRWRADGAAA